PPTRFREALDQRIGLGVEMQVAPDPTLCARGVHRGGQAGEPRAGLQIKDDGNPIDLRCFQMLDETRELRHGKVRYGVIAAVLERSKRHALARARNATDQQQIHRDSCPARAGGRPRLPPSPFILCCFPMNALVLRIPRWWSTKLRRAASTRTARFPPAATGIVTLRIGTPRIS